MIWVFRKNSSRNFTTKFIFKDNLLYLRFICSAGFNNNHEDKIRKF